MPSPLRALVLVLCIPAAAFADDDPVTDTLVTSPSEVPAAGPGSTTVISNVGNIGTPAPPAPIAPVTFAPGAIAPVPVDDDDHGERYTRARIVALVTF